jgi:hypothetical protein
MSFRDELAMSKRTPPDARAKWHAKLEDEDVQRALYEATMPINSSELEWESEYLEKELIGRDMGLIRLCENLSGWAGKWGDDEEGDGTVDMLAILSGINWALLSDQWHRNSDLLEDTMVGRVIVSWLKAAKEVGLYVEVGELG